MKGRMLVAGIGNIFLGDDGFGVEVARRLADEALPDWVRVADYGIRGIHLAYELLDGYGTTILVDATPRGGKPGTIYVIEPELSRQGQDATMALSPVVDAHGMEPGAVLAWLERLGGQTGRILVVGCEPAEIEERMGLSEPVARAVDDAIRVVRELIENEGSAAAIVGSDDRDNGQIREEI